MTAAAGMTLPGSRALPGWWRDLGEHSPRRFWFAHLVLHRVEALVEVTSPTPLSALARGLLAAVGHAGDPSNLEVVAATLGLDRDLAAALAGTLVRDGLIGPSPNGQLGPLTDAGRAALAGGRAATREERRVFYFADTRPPAYLPLPPIAATPLPPPSGWRFDLSALEGCLAKPDEWKARHDFPREVVRLVWERGSVDERNWHAVPLDRPEQALLLLVETGRNELVGLGIRADTWALVREPLMRLPFDGELIAALGGEVRLDEWRAAWLAWCQQRSFPASDAEACKLEPAGHKLLVKPPSRLMERLRQARSEALRGEAWLLAGSGRARPAALVEVVS
jgi:hypothetical protein